MMESQPNVKVFQPVCHKGGSKINKLLNINANEDNIFSFDEYRNAIENERVKRQTILKSNNEEILNHREEKRFNNLNNPNVFEKNQQLSNRVMTERMKQNISKNIRKHHNEVFETNNDPVQTNRELIRLEKLNDPIMVEDNERVSKRVMSERMKQNISKNIRKHHNEVFETNNNEGQTNRELIRLETLNDPTMVENNKQLSNRVMSERMKQSISTNICKHHNDIFEAQQYVNRYNLPGDKPKDDNWNINNITFETSENGSQITRVVIRKKRGDRQNELIISKL